MSDGLVEMYADCGVYCASSIYDHVIANADRIDVTLLVASVVLNRDSDDGAIDKRFPELKSYTRWVKGHRGTRSYFQFVVVENKGAACYIIAARDLSKEDPLKSLDDLDPTVLTLLYDIAERQPA